MAKGSFMVMSLESRPRDYGLKRITFDCRHSYPGSGVRL